MTRTTFLFATLTLLACGACSPPNPPQAPASAGSAAPSPSAGPAPSATDKKPAPESATSDLKGSYPDKAAFLAGVQGTRQTQAVSLDGVSVWAGFGPTIDYHTNKDGSISR